MYYKDFYHRTEARRKQEYKDSFIGMYKIEDLTAKSRQLKQIIAHYNLREFPCTYNLSTGKVNCLYDCISYQFDVVCPKETLYKAKRKLSLLKTHPLLMLAFSDPELAAVNDLLNREGVINSHMSVPEELSCGCIEWMAS